MNKIITKILLFVSLIIFGTTHSYAYFDIDNLENTIGEMIDEKIEYALDEYGVENDKVMGNIERDIQSYKEKIGRIRITIIFIGIIVISMFIDIPNKKIIADLKDVISGVSDDIKVLSSQLDELKSHVDGNGMKIDEEIETLEGRIETLEGRIETLEETIETFEGRIGTLEDQNV